MSEPMHWTLQTFIMAFQQAADMAVVNFSKSLCETDSSTANGATSPRKIGLNSFWQSNTMPKSLKKLSLYPAILLSCVIGILAPDIWLNVLTRNAFHIPVIRSRSGWDCSWWSDFKYIFVVPYENARAAKAASLIILIGWNIHDSSLKTTSFNSEYTLKN